MSETEPSVEAIADLKTRYHRLAHAMQTGVALKMRYYEREADPKHIRVGINSALVESAALTQLLLEKGIITELEYWTALCKQMDAEVASYKQWLEDHLEGEVALA